MEPKFLEKAEKRVKSVSDSLSEAELVFQDLVLFFGGKPKVSNEFFDLWDLFLRQVDANSPKEAVAQKTATETKRKPDKIGAKIGGGGEGEEDPMAALISQLKKGQGLQRDNTTKTPRTQQHRGPGLQMGDISEGLANLRKV
eukprot:c5321_g1_i2.p1 GENE.c5321_g1_i2~~c5321_g1_i2.p1  ORF type:complete len:142 (+),score=32.15 c5321_g1_i2:1-426(+)